MKTIFVILGFIFLCLGIVGIYMPFIPATPFLLLASYFFAKGSKKFNSWFINTKIYRNNIEPIVRKEGLTLKRKIKILTMITIFLGISIFVMSNVYGRIVLVLILIFHYLYFFLAIKTVEEQDYVK